MSYPGMGNDYIRESVMDQVDSNCLVIIMWSGLDRKAQQMSPPRPLVTHKLTDQEIQRRVMMSFEVIQQLKTDLVQKNIDHVFTQYINLLYPPFVAWRDTTPTWIQHLDRKQLRQVSKIIDVPDCPEQYLYDYAFFNNHLDRGDGFHPPVECNLDWTDKVLLPAVAAKGLIVPVDQK
jgi:hypothetical protein